MMNELIIDTEPRNFLIISSDIQSRYNIVLNKISEFYKTKENKILDHPDIKYVCLPIIDKAGKVEASLSNEELLLRNYGLLDSKNSNRVGNDITINQIREIISFTQISAYEGKKFVIINSASSMNNEASSALLKTLEEVSSNCTFILLSSSFNDVHVTIKSRCQILSIETEHKFTQGLEFLDYFYAKHYFLKSVNKEYDLDNLVQNISSQIDGLLDNTLDPIDISNGWSKSHVNLILYIISEYIIYISSKSLNIELSKNLHAKLKKLSNIFNKLPSIKKNLDLNINVKYLLNNLTIELAA